MPNQPPKPKTTQMLAGDTCVLLCKSLWQVDKKTLDGKFYSCHPVTARFTLQQHVWIQSQKHYAGIFTLKKMACLADRIEIYSSVICEDNKTEKLKDAVEFCEGS